MHSPPSQDNVMNKITKEWEKEEVEEKNGHIVKGHSSTGAPNDNKKIPVPKPCMCAPS